MMFRSKFLRAMIAHMIFFSITTCNRISVTSLIYIMRQLCDYRTYVLRLPTTKMCPNWGTEDPGVAGWPHRVPLNAVSIDSSFSITAFARKLLLSSRWGIYAFYCLHFFFCDCFDYFFSLIRIEVLMKL